MPGNTQQRSGQHDFRQVLQPSPFHPRVEEHCRVKNWTSWNGYQTARVYDTLAAEYFAIRSSCSVMDLTPMEKYRIGGPDALKFLNRLVARDISGLKPNRVTYVLWCNDEGKVLDDGTIFHLRQGEYRLCSQHHQLDWLLISALGMDVSVIVETHEIAALAVQGPTAYSVLTAAGFEGLDQLKPFSYFNLIPEGGFLRKRGKRALPGLARRFCCNPILVLHVGATRISCAPRIHYVTSRPKLP